MRKGFLPKLSGLKRKKSNRINCDKCNNDPLGGCSRCGALRCKKHLFAVDDEMMCKECKAILDEYQD